MERLYTFSDFFMPHQRLVLALLCAALTLMLASQASPWTIVPLLCGLLLLWDYVRNSGVWIGFRAFRQGQLPRVRRSLRSVRWPQLLSPRSRAYYHWLRGVLEAADGRLEAARVHLLVAATGALRTENDRSLVQCLLAELALQQGNRAAAAEHVRLANALGHHGEVAHIITALRRRLDGTL
ncbi:hypothetical protein [Sulfurivermis fontis]|jgi:hypothetical protein|uniref:hypothetical protein n=1 Tax=Sulfurivermis fontis TaxID=1972068 RepID=UPI000FDB8098|nr:hypothetical protein [Sulfurivermis fontis]